MKKLKIALFAEVIQDNLDGVARTLANVFHKIPEEIEIRFFTSLPPCYSRGNVIPVLKISMPLCKEYTFYLPFFLSRLKEELNKFTPDVIHFIAPALLGWYAAIYGKIILFVSRLVEKKNLATLNKIYKKSNDRMPNCIFTGKLDNSKLGDVYTSSSIFLFPSTTETFANVVLEAMGSKIRPAVPDLGSSKDLVNDGVNGYICRAYDVDHYVDKIIFLLNNPDSYYKMAGSALEFSLTKRWGKIRSQLFDIYKQKEKVI